MKTILYTPMIVGLLSLVGCTRDEGQSILDQANEVHLESAAMAKELEKTLESLHDSTSTTGQKNTTDSLSLLLDLWQEALIEVPGFEHQHDHDGAHEHKPAPQMTEESMLEYQLQAKQALLLIQKEVEDLKKNKN